MEESASDLERFRQRWREEVNAKAQKSANKEGEPGSSKSASKDEKKKVERPINKPPTRHPLADVNEEENQRLEAESSEVIEKIEGLRLPGIDEDDFSNPTRDEPKSALEHYERAVEKESQGNLGDSLSHYKKAYRMDAKVDQAYRNKYFAHKWKQPSQNPSNAPATVPSTAHHAPDEPTPPRVAESLTISQLISSFAGLSIPNADPVIEGDKTPPCPIRRMPVEVLLEVLQHVAIQDPSTYVRLALVCKNLAFHVFAENSIWKRVALGPEFGLASQKYHFSTDIYGREVVYRTLEDDDDEDDNSEAPMPLITDTAFDKEQDWRSVFQNYPRIRYTGVYISTVTYTSAGAASVTSASWIAQTHLVTYYRYLRFFRDGTVISLLTTHEPVEVVHLLTKENLVLVRSNGKNSVRAHGAHASSTVTLPQSRLDQSIPQSTQSILKQALRGRWRLCHPSLETIGIGANDGIVGDLHIETEGVTSRYEYTMHLALTSARKTRTAAKNNKLQWKGFWSHHNLTDDWAEFHLRNDKAFFFSRVRSYGLGY